MDKRTGVLWQRAGCAHDNLHGIRGVINFMLLHTGRWKVWQDALMQMAINGVKDRLGCGNVQYENVRGLG
jgi:hypothetical protein